MFKGIRCIAVILLLVLLPALVLAESNAVLIALPETHAVLLHDNGITWLIGGADEQTVADALVDQSFYGVDYVVQICSHSQAAEALARLYHARLIAFEQDAALKGLDARWEGDCLRINATGATFLFGTETEAADAVAVRCDGTPLSPPPEADGAVYMLNLNTKKFHRLGCGSILQMKDKNKKTYIGDWQDIVNAHFSPCKRCHPAQ